MLVGVIGEESLLGLSLAPAAGPYVDKDIFYAPTIFVPGFLLLEGPFFDTDIIPTAFVTQGAGGVFPDPLLDVDQFYAFTTGASDAIVATLVTDDDLIYSPSISQLVLAPLLVPSDDQFRSPVDVIYVALSDGTVDQDVFYRSIIRLVSGNRHQYAMAASVAFDSGTTIIGGQIGSSVVVAGSATQTTLPSGALLPPAFFADDVIYAPVPSQRLSPPLLSDEVIYPPFQGPPHLYPNDILDIDIFPATATGHQQKLLPKLPTTPNDNDVINGPTITQPGSMGLVVDVDTFYIPSMAVSAALLPSLVASDDAILASFIGLPVLQPGDAVVDFADTFYAPSVLVQITLAPFLWVDVDNIRSIPSLAQGQGAGPGLVLDSDVVFAPTVAGTSMLSPAIFSDADVLYAPTIFNATQYLQTGTPLDAETFYQPLVSIVTSQTLAAGLVTDTDTFYAPTVKIIPKQRMLSSSRAGVPSIVLTGPNVGYCQVVSNIGAVD